MKRKIKRKRQRNIKPKTSLRWRASPIKSSFMAASMIGALVSIYYIIPQVSTNYGIAFLMVFLAMFVASLISMAKAPVPENWGAK